MTTERLAEVTAALADAGWPARRWGCLSFVHGAGIRRSVWRVELADGRIVKARCIEDGAGAEALAAIRRELPADFAPVLHRHGAVLLEAWIDGEDLAQRPATDAQLAAAAVLLARLHSTQALQGRALPMRHDTVRERALADAARLRVVAEGLLDAAEGVEVAAALERLDPAAAAAGLVHTDFCGENIVVDGVGALHVVDNERMGVGPLGLDVARAWYRWGLPPARWAHFRAHYEACMPHADAVRHFGFWARVAVLKSAALRLAINPASAHVPIECLRQLSAAAGPAPQ